MEKNKIKIFLLCLIIVFSIAFIGSLFTSGNTNSEWYQSIKPDITPPNIVFPIIWNILFFLIATSLYLSWTNSKNKKQKKELILAFGINFILNLLWTALYFGLRNPLLAFIEIFLLWTSIIFLIYKTQKINKISGYLLIPYFIWVSFAIILNYLSI